MKKLTAIYDDNVVVDITSLVTYARDIRIEQLPNGKPSIKRHHVSGKQVPDVIMAHFSPRAEFTGNQAIKWVTAEGYKAGSAVSALSKLVKTGRLERGKRGAYVFIK